MNIFHQMHVVNVLSCAEVRPSPSLSCIKWPRHSDFNSHEIHKIHVGLWESFGLQVRQLGDIQRATEFARLRGQLIASGAVKALVAPRRPAAKRWEKI